MRVALFTTCLGGGPGAGSPISDATQAVLDRLGVDVAVPGGQDCCAGDSLTGVRRHLGTFVEHEAVVIPSASCVATVRHLYPALARRAGDEGLARAVEDLAARTYELAEFLVDVLGVVDVGASFPHQVAYHPTCHPRYRSPRPLRLLRAVRGIDVLEPADGTLDGAPRACADASCLGHAGGDGRALHLAEILAAREGA